MRIIKLNAINSTNEYLKQYVKENSITNTCISYTFNQTKGKGQRGKSWLSEPDKNIAFSICLFPENLKVNDQFSINMLFSLFIINILKSLKIPDLSIKWPNDILSGGKKICGILNEIRVKGNKIDNVIIGFGINVNQEKFKNLPNAYSLKLIKKINYDLGGLVNLIIQSLKRYDYLNPKTPFDFEKLTINYHKNLFGVNENKFFLDSENKKFIGKIISVNKLGIIKIKIEDNSIKNYTFQEIQMIY